MKRRLEKFLVSRANLMELGANPVDLPVDEADDSSIDLPFKGNIDLEKLESLIKKVGPKNIPLGMLTVTNNSAAGQPVSMDNIRQTAEVLKKYGILFFIDACRFAENAWFIKKRDPRYNNKSTREIALEMFSYADGCTMSANKRSPKS